MTTLARLERTSGGTSCRGRLLRPHQGWTGLHRLRRADDQRGGDERDATRHRSQIPRIGAACLRAERLDQVNASVVSLSSCASPVALMTARYVRVGRGARCSP